VLKNNLVIALLFLSLLGGCTGKKEPPPVPEKLSVKRSPGRCEGCNVILVSIDSLRADHMSLHGYKRPTTPEIDSWAAGGVVFEKFFSTSYLTPISEAGVHTGRYPETNGVIGFRSHIAPSVQTMAELLQEAGYDTATFGNSPEFLVHESLRKSFSRGMARYEVTERFANGRRLDWPAIEGFLNSRGKTEKPFFLWVPLGAAHAPFGQGAEPRFNDPAYNGPFLAVQFYANLQFYYDGWLYDLTSPKWRFQLFEVHKENLPMHVVKKKLEQVKWPVRVGKKDIQYMVDLYDNGVRLASEEFGRLLERVKGAGLLENTVIVLQSQHGETLGEHGYIAHYDIWDDSTHVPLVVTSPAISDPRRIPHLASGVDVLPTVLDHLGLKAPALDGQPLLGPSAIPRQEVFLTRTPLWESILRIDGENNIFDRFRAQDDKIGFKDYAIRTPTEKLIHRRARLAEEQFSAWTYVTGKKIRRSEWEAYDLVKDPGEQKVITKLSPRLEALRDRLLQFEKDMEKRAVRTSLESAIQDYR
jgi:arylsulfatase A-like enzyme